jgi:hypothetical protein
MTMALSISLDLVFAEVNYAMLSSLNQNGVTLPI